MNIDDLKLSDIHLGLSKTISKELLRADIENFVKITGDKHPLHTNKRYAKSCGYPDIIAHGLLISSYASALIGMKLPGRSALITSEKFEYRLPCFPGDKLKIIGIVKEIDERFSRVNVKIEILNQDERKTASGRFDVIVRA